MDINSKIKEIKARIKLLTNHFPYTKFEINLLTICYIAITSIDNDIADILDEVLSRIFILFNYGEFDNLLGELKLDSKDPGAFVITNFDLSSKYNDEFIYINIKQVKDDEQINISFLIRHIIHELKHAINEVVNSYQKANDNAYLITGLNEYEYGQEINESDSYLDEAFNSFITDIYLEQLNNIKIHDIEDKEIKRILNSFNFDWQGIYTYDCTYLLEPLFCDIDFFRVFYNAILYKDYAPLVAMLSQVFKRDYKTITDVNNDLNTYLQEFEDEANCEVANYFDTYTNAYPKRELKIKSYYDNI